MNSIEDPTAVFFRIANKIDMDWIKLAAILDPLIDIEAIKAKNYNIVDQAMTFLYIWYQKRGSYTYSTFEELKNGLRCIRRFDIAHEISRNQELPPLSELDNQIEEGNNKTSKSTEDPTLYFYDIANRIGMDWTKLAAILDHSINVEVIKSQHQHVFDQALELLNIWGKRHDPCDILSNLEDALLHIDRYDIVEGINSNQEKRRLRGLDNQIKDDNKKMPKSIGAELSIGESSSNGKSNYPLDDRDSLSVDKKEKVGLQNSYQDVPSALKEKEYKEAYAKARREGFCRNDFIRFMITGPQNVGKSCFIQAFTQQGLIHKIGPTTAAVVAKKLVKLLTYNVDNKTVDEFIDVLARKVVAAIETVKRKMREERPFTDFSFSDNPRTTLASQFPPYVCSHSSASNADHIASQPVPIDEETIPLDFLEKYFRESYKLNTDIVIDEYHYGKLWDFAGQSIYHITHQPFISCNCIYILVLDMSQDIDKKVVDRSGNDTKMTYLEAIQEWLVSIIGSSKSKVRTENKIIGAPENIAWPIVILIGTHADKIGDEKACQRRFKEFCQCINEKLPSYSRHIYRSKIIFNCNDKDNSKKTLLQRQKNCGQLHNILKDFVHNQPSIDHFSKIPFKWYIMAAILHTSLDRFNEQAVKFSTNLNQRVSRIMTAEEVELLAKKYKLCEGKDDIHQMLLYLHDLGEIVYCQKEPVKGKVITQVEWLLNIFRTIIQLDEPDSNGLAMDLEYEAIRNKGIMSQHYIYGKFDQLEVKQKERKFLLDLMESYDMICKISNKDDNHPDQYFVPYLFRSNNQEFDHKEFMTSGWLYVGFKSSKIHYIPDGIFFCLLVSCYKEWKGSSIEPRSKCAKYRLKNDLCDIIVKKESSYIGIQYRYRMIPNNPRLQGQIKDKVKKLIYEKPPYIFIRNKLESLIKERMPRCQNSDCLYFIKCPLSPCDRFLQIKNPVQDNLKLLYCDCNGIYECESAHGWTISLESANIGQGGTVTQNAKDPIQDDSKRHDIFVSIANNIKSAKLEEFGRRLYLSSNDISDIVDSNASRFSKCFRLLEAWYSEFGSAAEFDTIFRILRGCKETKIADQLKKNYLE